MLHTKQEQKSHLSVIATLLSTYQVLTIRQLDKLFPELSEEKVLLLLRQLERKRRIAYHPDSGYVCHSRECIPSHSRIAAFWVMLDFQPHVTFHTVSEFPITLTFYTKADGFNIIHVPIGKEMLINQAMSGYHDDDLTNLVVIDRVDQIPLLSFPGIGAYCTVSEDGQVQYYQKQGVTVD